MSFNRSLFYDFKITGSFKAGMHNNNYSQAYGRGPIIIPTMVSERRIKCKLHDVLFIPDVAYNLDSVRAIDSTGHSVVFDGNKCQIEKRDKTMAENSLTNGLFTYFANPGICSDAGNMALVTDMKVWHQQLAHVHYDGIRSTIQNEDVQGTNLDKEMAAPNCIECIYRKCTRAPVPQTPNSQFSTTLELVHTAVCGTVPTRSVGGSGYCVVFIDDYSRYSWMFAIKGKVIFLIPRKPGLLRSKTSSINNLKFFNLTTEERMCPRR